jgi:hypothetical protein
MDKFKPGVEGIVMIFSDNEGNNVYEFPYYRLLKDELEPLLLEVGPTWGPQKQIRLRQAACSLFSCQTMCTLRVQFRPGLSRLQFRNGAQPLLASVVSSIQPFGRLSQKHNSMRIMACCCHIVQLLLGPSRQWHQQCDAAAPSKTAAPMQAAYVNNCPK